MTIGRVRLIIISAGVKRLKQSAGHEERSCSMSSNGHNHLGVRLG